MKGVTQSQYEILAAFRYSLRKFLHFSEERARAAGLMPQQHQALLSIKGFPGGAGRVTISQLAERMQLRHHSTVGLVDRLEAQGLVRREPSPADRRQVLVRLSARGESILADLSAMHREELQRMLPELEQLMAELSGKPVHR